MKEKQILTINKAKKVTGIHYTTKHTGKMDGMMSLSTSVLCNPYCQAYAKDPDRICSKCYAATQMKCYTSMQKCFEKNTEILTTKLLGEDEIPLINAAYFRFEAFGDIQNVTQVTNYFNICKRNPHVKFALWSKNPWIINDAINSGVDKPKNLQIVYSSPYINQYKNPGYSFVDKVFTVYDKKFAEQNGIDINCGARSCLACHKCYESNNVTEVNELLK